MMGAIYQCASRVITYMGSAREASSEKRGIQLLNGLHQHFSPLYGRLQQRLGITDARELLRVFPALEVSDNLMKSAKKDSWRWLIALSFGSYASSLWMVQEQLLNERIVVLRGPNVFSWEAVAIGPALIFLGFIPNYYVTSIRGTTLSAGIGAQHWTLATSIFSIWLLRRNGRLVEQPSLMENMYYYHDMLCQGPRDRIYAVLTVSRDLEELDIQPDYSKPAHECFIQASAAILGRQHDLLYLTLVGFFDNLRDPLWPSWALNLPRPLRSRPSTVPQDCTPHPFQQSHTSPRLLRDDSVLVLKGRILDHVAYSTTLIHLGDPFAGPIIDATAIDTVTKLLGTWYKKLPGALHYLHRHTVPSHSTTN
jgi:hypothetical protein